MNRDDIIRMASNEYGIYAFTADSLAEFAALVAAAEREACARVCDERKGRIYTVYGSVPLPSERGVMKHSCHNREPFKQSLRVQDGWLGGALRNMKQIQFRMSNECEWSKEHDDDKCTGCRWKQSIGGTGVGTD